MEDESEREDPGEFFINENMKSSREKEELSYET